MRDEVKRMLDGAATDDEASAVLAALPEAERREARAHLALARAAARLPRPAPAAGFEARAMARVRAAAPPRRSLWSWLRSPRVTPLGALGGALAAGLVAFGAAALLGRGEPAPAPTVLAQLELRAPEARSVAVAGDFNGWRPEATPLRRGEGGRWTARIPLAPGRRYEYLFVVDGEWVADPAAGARADDGFGGENAVLEL